MYASTQHIVVCTLCSLQHINGYAFTCAKIQSGWSKTQVMHITHITPITQIIQITCATYATHLQALVRWNTIWISRQHIRVQTARATDPARPLLACRRMEGRTPVLETMEVCILYMHAWRYVLCVYKSACYRDRHSDRSIDR